MDRSRISTSSRSGGRCRSRAGVSISVGESWTCRLCDDLSKVGLAAVPYLATPGVSAGRGLGEKAVLSMVWGHCVQHVTLFARAYPAGRANECDLSRPLAR